MIFLLTNFAVEIVLSGAWWLIRNSLYGISSYVWGLVYRSKEDDKYHINEKKWNELIEETKLQQREIKELRGLIERWTDIKTKNNNETDKEIAEELTNYLKNSLIEK
jgi:hypothetical protein